MSTFSEKRPVYKGYKAVTGEKEKSVRESIAAKKAAAQKNADGRPTFAYFATHDTEFIEACGRAGIPATARQASKWARKRGLAWANRQPVQG